LKAQRVTGHILHCFACYSVTLLTLSRLDIVASLIRMTSPKPIKLDYRGLTANPFDIWIQIRRLTRICFSLYYYLLLCGSRHHTIYLVSCNWLSLLSNFSFVLYTSSISYNILLWRKFIFSPGGLFFVGCPRFFQYICSHLPNLEDQLVI
jgi:hypothetical protein